MKKWVFLFLGWTTAGFAANYTGPQIKDIFLGPHRSCALLQDDRVKCWGSNTRGFFNQNSVIYRDMDIGDDVGEMGDRTPVLVTNGKKIDHIVMNEDELCALHPTEEATCWYNIFEPRPQRFKGKLTKIKKIAMGRLHKCGIFNDNKVACWGKNSYRQIPIPRGQRFTLFIDSEFKTEIDLPTSAGKPIDVKITHVTTCVLFDSGQVRCWGAESGQFWQNGLQGVERKKNNKTLDPVKFGSTEEGEPLKAIELIGEANYGHMCAKFQNGKYKCWGMNSYGQLGIGKSATVGYKPNSMGNDLPYVNLGLIPEIQQLSVGGANSCALLINGAIKCWGHGRSGINGQENEETLGHTPQTVGDYIPYVFLGKREKATKIRVSGYGYAHLSHACALLETGGVKCWGSNLHGGLGLEHDEETIGTIPNQMGDNLPYVNLGK